MLPIYELEANIFYKYYYTVNLIILLIRAPSVQMSRRLHERPHNRAPRDDQV